MAKRRISRRKLTKKLAKRERLTKDQKLRLDTAWCKPGALAKFRLPLTPHGKDDWVFDHDIDVWFSLSDFREWARGKPTPKTACKAFSSENLRDVYAIVVERCRPVGHFVFVKIIFESTIGWVKIEDLVKVKSASR